MPDIALPGQEGSLGSHGLLAHPTAWVRFAALPLQELDDVKDIDAMWADQRVRAAVRLASPSLAQALARRGGQPVPDDDRLYRSLRSYYSRMGTRPTPFGLMAGVFSARMRSAATTATADLSLAVRLRHEQLDLAAERFADDELVQANAGLERTGSGFLVPPRGSLRSRQEQSTYVEATPTMLHVIDMLEEPMSASSAAAQLAGQSGSQPGEWLRYLRYLERHNVIVRAAPIGSRPWLTTGAAGKCRPGEVPDARNGQSKQRSAVSVDAFAVRADGTDLPAEVGQHAVALCEALDLANPAPAYPPHLEATALDFADRFGPGAEVPVLEAFSLLRGIPLRRPVPRLSPRDPQAPLTRRDQLLSAAAGTADLGGTIDDSSLALLGQLAREGRQHDPRPYAPAQELSLRSVAGTGGLTSEMTYGGAASALGGRFVHLLTAAGRAAHQELIESTERYYDPVEVAELVVTPALAGRRVPGVTPVVASRRRLVSLAPGALADGPWSTGAQDILVGVDPGTGRLYLRSARSGRLLHLVQSSMAHDDLLQPAEALLLQVCRAQFRYVSEFDWGAVSPRAFLPGVRVGPVYLCTPRWLLSDRDVQDDPGALRDWIGRWEVPARFVARKIGSDRGFLIRRGIDDELLLHLLRRVSPAQIEIKAPPDLRGESILRDSAGRPHVSDIVVTVLREPAGTGPVVTGPVAAPAPLPPDARSEWATVDLALPWPVLPRFLCDRLGCWLTDHAAAPVADRAWWNVTQLPEPRLRVYLPARSAAELDAAAAFWLWCRKARANGDLARVSQAEHHVYEGLFGDRGLLGLAHSFFAADARAAMQIVRTTPGYSAAFTLGCSARLYRMLAESGLPWPQIRELARREEQDAGRELHARIGRELYAVTMPAGDQADWLGRWRALAAAAGPRLGALIGPLTRLSVDRMCVSSSLRPHIYGAVRRLVDRRIYECRSAR